MEIYVLRHGEAEEGGAGLADRDRKLTAKGKRDLKAEAMSSPAVQAVLDVFPGEIKDVEEL